MDMTHGIRGWSRVSRDSSPKFETIGSVQQFEASFKHPRGPRGHLFPMRIVAFATPVKHQVETGDHPKAIAREGAEPSHLIFVHLELCYFRILGHHLFGRKKRRDRCIACVCPIREKADPTKIE